MSAWHTTPSMAKSGGLDTKTLGGFQYDNVDIVIRCVDTYKGSTWIARVHKDKLLAMFPGMQHDLTDESSIPAGQNKDTEAEEGASHETDGEEDDIVEVMRTNTRSAADITETKDTLPRFLVECDTTAFIILLAYAYNKGHLMDLGHYPHSIRGHVWLAALKYDCPSLMLYAESSILMAPEGITAPFALTLCVKAKEFNRGRMMKDLMPFTLREDLTSASRDPEKLSGLCSLDVEQMLKLARLHVHAALYDEGYIRRAKAAGIQDNDLAISVATALCNHGIKAKPVIDHPSRRSSIAGKEVELFAHRNFDWGHWPSAECASVTWPNKHAHSENYAWGG